MNHGVEHAYAKLPGRKSAGAGAATAEEKDESALQTIRRAVWEQVYICGKRR